MHTLAETLRLELNGEPVRVIEIAPGMVRTDEFSLNRLGSADAADAVYRGVREPLVADDIADCIAWTVTRPHHVNIDLMVVRPLRRPPSTRSPGRAEPMEIRPAREADWSLIYPFFSAIVAEGRTYAYPDGLSADEARPLWMEEPPGGRSWRWTARRCSGRRRWAPTGPAVARTSPPAAS